MAYCSNCDPIKLDTTSVTVSGDVLTVNVIPGQAYCNRKPYTLVIGCAFPAFTGTEPVAITDGTVTLPLLDANAQPVVAGQLRRHRKYQVRYGAGGIIAGGNIPAHFTVKCGLECMEYSSVASLQ